MTPDKRKKLKKAGWKVSSAHEFLSLSDAKSAYISQKPALKKSLKSKRIKKAESDRNSEIDRLRRLGRN